MKINKAKTKVMMINPRRRAADYLPEIKIRQDKLEVINETRLVGVIITDDMKWDTQLTTHLLQACQIHRGVCCTGMAQGHHPKASSQTGESTESSTQSDLRPAQILSGHIGRE